MCSVEAVASSEITAWSLRARPLARKIVKGDGNCLFRCLSYVLYGNEDHHLPVRKRVIQTLNNPEVWNLEEVVQAAKLRYRDKVVTPSKHLKKNETDAPNLYSRMCDAG